MHKFKDICLWLSHICLKFHLFHPVFYFPNNLPPSLAPFLPPSLLLLLFISLCCGGALSFQELAEGMCHASLVLFLYEGILEHGDLSVLV